MKTDRDESLGVDALLRWIAKEERLALIRLIGEMRKKEAADGNDIRRRIA